MFRFTIRDLLWLTVVVALSVGWWNQYRVSTQKPKLYRDDEVENIAHNPKHVVDYDADPYYLVVPPGQTMPRRKVFSQLGIDEKHLTNFSYTGYNRVRILS